MKNFGKHVLQKAQDGLDKIELPEVPTTIGFEQKDVINTALVIVIAAVVIMIANKMIKSTSL